MPEAQPVKLTDPRIVDGESLLIAGISQSYTFETAGGISDQWRAFEPYLETMPGRIGKLAYGVMSGGDASGEFDYLCGVEVVDGVDLPRGMMRIELPAQTYAVFTHAGTVDEVQSTMNAIMSDWLPRSGYEAAKAPLFERYLETFSPANPVGGIEIWVPITA